MSSMDRSNPSTDSMNVPLMASVARRIMEELFQKRAQWRRAELAAEVERIHLERGGTKGKQDAQRIVKKALAALEEDGKVESPAYGQWRWKASGSLPSNLPSHDGVVLDNLPIPTDEDKEEEITPERQIGEGPESVYLYYNPNDRKLAGLEGRDFWECKIGRTAAADAPVRIISQGAKTALSRIPVVG